MAAEVNCLFDPGVRRSESRSVHGNAYESFAKFHIVFFFDRACSD